VTGWEEVVFNWTCSLAQEIAKLLESVDEELMKAKEQSLKVECLKEHRITTVFGHVKVRRRLYWDNNGDYRFLLDEKMGRKTMTIDKSLCSCYNSY
jgi:hypothetical protein